MYSHSNIPRAHTLRKNIYRELFELSANNDDDDKDDDDDNDGDGANHRSTFKPSELKVIYTLPSALKSQMHSMQNDINCK